MPKYYCDYCDIFLTHDSTSVRKAHNSGWKHKEAVYNYYRNLSAGQRQAVIDDLVKSHEKSSAVQGWQGHLGFPPPPSGQMPMSRPPPPPPPFGVPPPHSAGGAPPPFSPHMYPPPPPPPQASQPPSHRAYPPQQFS